MISKWLEDVKTELEIHELLNKNRSEKDPNQRVPNMKEKVKRQRENDALLKDGQRLETYKEEIDRIIWQEREKGDFYTDTSSREDGTITENDSAFTDQIIAKVKLDAPSVKNCLGLSISLT